ncbi:MAG: maleylpyruvate isomerase N-terminal domain-containing protein [Propionibacteriales bacterium]|nr:maleylpyruvate isomerase N-terminal domain-containing protein [Propionibacteriales bacterium]
MSDLSHSTVCAAYRDGVSEVREAVTFLGEGAAQSPTPCPEWNVLELVTHLWCTADRYHRLLGYAVAGCPERMLVNEELAVENERAVVAAAATDLNKVLSSFVSSAEAYLPRATVSWEVAPYQVGGGSVGDALGVAAIEWHIHAWDLRKSVGHDYRPTCAETLRWCWNRAVPHLPITTDGDAWAALLAAAGRRGRAE